MASGCELSLIGEIEILSDQKALLGLGRRSDRDIVASLQAFLDHRVSVEAERGEPAAGRRRYVFIELEFHATLT